MPVTAAPQRKTVVKHGKAATPLFQAPEALEPDRPTDHNGIPVESEELLGNLPSGARFKISKLHLANGEVAYACRECLFTGDTMSIARTHRNEEHGARFGFRPPKTEEPEEPEESEESETEEEADESPADESEPLADDDDDVLAPPVIEPKLLSDPPLGRLPRKAFSVPTLPKEILDTPLGEFIALCPSIHSMGKNTERLQAEIDDLKAQLQASKISREDQYKIDVFESSREQIIDLRMQMHRHQNCDSVKAERDALRAWKKKITAKLATAGFRLSEEDK